MVEKRMAGLHLHNHTQDTDWQATDKASTEQEADILGTSLLWEKKGKSACWFAEEKWCLTTLPEKLQVKIWWFQELW
jgi:hypothetical protein